MQASALHNTSRVVRRRITMLVIIGTALLTLMIKLHIARTTIGTNDVQTWQYFTDQIRSIGAAALYRQEPNFNHPPLMSHVLRLIGWLSTHSGLPFPFWLRLPAIIADLVAVAVVLRLVGPSLPVILLVACPPLIMISGFHGNTDPVMIMWVLVAVWILERAAVTTRSAAVAGAAIALALSTKIVPVILLPVFLLWLPTRHTRVSFMACLTVVTLAVSLPELIVVPQAILHNVLDYKSVYGQWGIGRLLWLGRHYPRPQWLALADHGFERYGRLLDAAAVVALAGWLNWPGRAKPALFMQCGLTLLLFLSISPGFGVQYLAWVMPWLVGAGLRAVMIVYVTCSIFLASVYSFWAGYWPWYYAPSPTNGWSSRVDIIAVELLAWAAIVAATCMLASAIHAWRRQTHLTTELERVS